MILPKINALVCLLVFWTGAFVCLCLALVALNVFLDVIDSDSELMSLGKELALADVASAIVGIAVWSLAAFVPESRYIPSVGSRRDGLPGGALRQLPTVRRWDASPASDGVLSSVTLVLGHWQLASMIVGGCTLFQLIFAKLVGSL